MSVPVPEHSVPLMTCLSGGEALREDGYLFLTGEGWLMGIGYRDNSEPKDLEPNDLKPDDPVRFAAAWGRVRQRVRAEDFFVMAPRLPASMRGHMVEEDVFYTLPAKAEIPAALRNPVRRAGDVLRVEEGRAFTPDHRRLWAEFLTRTPLNNRVRRLYAGTEKLVREVPGVTLLDARDAAGHLTACLVLDSTLPDAVSYIIGAHSRTHYAPHASDLLFATMLDKARAEGKQRILLGLGVNAGITRFKRKWGGVIAQPYELAVWREATASGHVDALLKAMLAAPADMSKRQIFASLPEQKPFAMLWRLDKNGRTSWIGGAAHFFCCSFERSLRALFDRVDTVLFEGPLDPESLDAVARHGQSPEPGSPRVADFLSEAEVRGLERVVNGPFPRLARMLNASAPPAVDVRHRLAHTRPWFAFFSLWTAYLERNGWANSVDMDAWNLALDMGKAVLGMESLAEQIASLESAPLPRIVRFMQQHGRWRRLKNSNESAYLWGHLEGMLGTSAEFPTRTEFIIDVRDQRFRERMRPRLEEGGVAVFVGSAHMLNLRRMLAADGFTVTRELPTWKHRLRAWWLHDPELVLRPPDAVHAGNAGSASAVGRDGSGVTVSVPGVSAPVVSAPVVSVPRVSVPPLFPARNGSNRPDSGADLEWLTADARVPEQILSYVRAVSPTPPVLRGCNGFAAWVAGPSLVLVGFDPEGPEDVGQSASFAERLTEAVDIACREPGIERITVLAPDVPANAPGSANIQHDTWWGLPLSVDSPLNPPQKTRNMIRRALQDVVIAPEGWTADHTALVNLYLRERTDLAPGTRALFGNLERYAGTDGVCALSARTRSGALGGFVLGDCSALRMAFHLYAFRAQDAPPGTADALVAALAEVARARGHTCLNLGLGIRESIAFFKRKWGAQALFPHVETSWNLHDIGRAS